MVDKSDIAGFINNSDLNKRVATLTTKEELKPEQDKIIKPQAFDSSCFRGKSHFEDDDTQSYLVFQPMYRYLKKRLVMLIVYQNGNLKHCMIKLLNFHLYLIIVFLQH